MWEGELKKKKQIPEPNGEVEKTNPRFQTAQMSTMGTLIRQEVAKGYGSAIPRWVEGLTVQNESLQAGHLQSLSEASWLNDGIGDQPSNTLQLPAVLPSYKSILRSGIPPLAMLTAQGTSQNISQKIPWHPPHWTTRKDHHFPKKSLSESAVAHNSSILGRNPGNLGRVALGVATAWGAPFSRPRPAIFSWVMSKRVKK